MSFKSYSNLICYESLVVFVHLEHPWAECDESLVEMGNQPVILLETALERGNPLKNLNKAHQSEMIYFLKL